MSTGKQWRIVLVAPVLILSMLLAACGGSGDRAKEDGESGQEKAADPAERAYEDLLAKFDASKIPEPLPPQESYERRLAKFGEDYGECGQETAASARTCEKPASLGGRELKENINVELILDASGSMRADAGGERKMDAARSALTDFIGTLPESANVSLRVYGHVGTSDEADRERSCAASELILPFQKLDRQKFSEAVNSFEPSGWTPVAGSLEKAREDFAQFDPETNSNFVYMVSDGVETCGGDPASAASALAADDVRAEVNIIGFDVDPEAANQLREAAESGSGSYYEASDADELNQVFRERFDWTEWTAYYNCIEGNAYGEYNTETGTAYSNYNCITGKAYSEYNAVTGDAYARYNEISGGEYGLYNKISNAAYSEDEYEKYRDGILELAVKRRDSRIEAAEKERDYTVEHAEEQRDGIVEPAEAERDTEIQAALEERDEVLESVDEGREDVDPE